MSFSKGVNQESALHFHPIHQLDILHLIVLRKCHIAQRGQLDGRGTGKLRQWVGDRLKPGKSR